MRFKRFVCSVIVFLLIGSCVACGGTSAETPADLPEGYTRLCGFESYGEFMAVTQNGYFGKYSLNDDAAYVKSGKSSVKLEVSGSGYGTDKPGLAIKPNMITDGREDFSGAERLTFDIYNAQNTTENCYFSTKLATGGDSLATKEMTYTLAPNAWTRCVYDFDYETMSLIYDFSECTQLLLSFDGVKAGEKKPVFYLDDILLKETQEVRKSFEIELDENEICDFEKDYQEYITYVAGYGAYKDYIPRISMNTDARFVSRGSKSLKLHIPHGSKNGSCWVRLMFADSLIQKLNFPSLDESYDIVFDLYNDSDSAFHVEGTLRGEGGMNYGINFAPPARTWKECRLSLSALIQKFPPKKEGDPTALERIGSFEITYGDFVGSSPADDKDLYIDNIRLEKKENN